MLPAIILAKQQSPLQITLPPIIEFLNQTEGKMRHFEDKSRENEDKTRRFEDKSRETEDKTRRFEDKSGETEDKMLQIEDKPEQILLEIAAAS